MDKLEFMQGIHMLQNNYHKKLTAEQLKLYYENLKDLSKEKFLENIKNIIKTNQYMPNIAQLRNETSKSNANCMQRDYTNFNFDSYYANSRR